MIKIGCCGFPQARSAYYKNFQLVEIQKSFYRPLTKEPARRWRSEAPPDFEFTLKAWQGITHPPSSPTYRKAKLEVPEEKRGNYGHFSPSKEVFDGWEATREAAKILEAKLILFQCPPSFSENEKNIRNLREFFSAIERDFLFGFEVRGKWNPLTIKELWTELDLIHVVDPFGSRVSQLAGKLTYYRLHGIGGYSYDYSRDELIRLRDLCKTGETTYVLFNNTQMLKNALEFKDLFS
jgi:uncharacterized protein YecE (DUF72 family)